MKHDNHPLPPCETGVRGLKAGRARSITVAMILLAVTVAALASRPARAEANGCYYPFVQLFTTCGSSNGSLAAGSSSGWHATGSQIKARTNNYSGGPRNIGVWFFYTGTTFFAGGTVPANGGFRDDPNPVGLNQVEKNLIINNGGSFCLCGSHTRVL